MSGVSVGAWAIAGMCGLAVLVVGDVVSTRKRHRTSTAIAHAPFTAAQVDNIRRWQALRSVHQLTCGREGCRKALEAFPAGLMCPDPACGYMQSWVHKFIADGEFPA